MANASLDNMYGMRSTYRSEYVPHEVLPPIFQHQPPSIELKHLRNLHPRLFPVIPTGPHRRLAKERFLGPGFTDIERERQVTVARLTILLSFYFSRGL